MITPPGISIQGQHRIEDKVLFDTQISIPAGGWTCLLGPSGVGKSTILRLILGFNTGGSFTGEITATDTTPLDGRCSYMAQSDLLMPWLSILDNVVIGARLRGERANLKRATDLLERVGLSAHAQKKPNALSGGMRQRAALARTLMEDRSVVLLDEPFSALDAGTRATMQELAVEMMAGRTVLLVTHDPAEAVRLADKIIVMSAQGTSTWPVLQSEPLRAIDAPETQAGQAELLTHLRTLAA